VGSLTQDLSANYGYINVTNLAGGTFVLSAAALTLSSAHCGRKIRYSGTTDFVITVPLNLPRGFGFEITPTGATGIVTFAAASGGLIASSGSKLRTLGQYATARLTNLTAKVFGLTGDLQV
jgi:hypothetical protein